MAIDLGFRFQNNKHFLKYFGFYLLTTVYTKKSDTSKFCLIVYLWNYNDKNKFSFLQTVQSSHNISYLQTSHFCVKC